MQIIHTNAGAAFAERLSALREEKKMPLDALAEVLGVSRPTLRGYETGKTLPDIEVLDRAAQYFNVTLNYLLGRDVGRSRKTTKLMKQTMLSEKAAAMLISLDELVRESCEAEGRLLPSQTLSLLLETDEMSKLLRSIGDILVIDDFADYGKIGDNFYHGLDDAVSLKIGDNYIWMNYMDAVYGGMERWFTRIIEGIRQGRIANRAKEAEQRVDED
ncbi:MAG: helix-turn-helix domain-containing protein [Firmicutes bacterium]|nr:helix-turn-helix domain-containing protein [Bacillota bacterium]